MKPVVNIDELKLESCGEGVYQHRYGIICAAIGAKKLGYNLTVVPPQHKANFFHNHHNNEEMFFIIEGSGVLRFGDQEFPIGRNDIIACPPGGKVLAHQIINTGSTEMRYIALSTKERVDIVEFPDSKKVSATAGDYAHMDYSAVFAQDSKVPYH